MSRLSAERRAGLRAYLRKRYELLKEYKNTYSNDALCSRFHVTPRTLAREAAAMNEPECLPKGHSRAARHVNVSIIEIEELTT